MRHVGILREMVFKDAQEPWVMLNALPHVFSAVWAKSDFLTPKNAGMGHALGREDLL